MIEHADIQRVGLKPQAFIRQGWPCAAHPTSAKASSTPAASCPCATACACTAPTGIAARSRPGQIAKTPGTQIFDYKCRLRCSRYGRAGSADEVEISAYLEVAPFTASV